MPRISVIIPSYNHAHFLPRAVDSVLAQDYGNVEIVVVDDGSTDDTATVAARYGDRIRYVHQENRGLAGARNTGLREARGEIVFFLDADDEVHGDTLGRLEEALSRAGEAFALVACLPRLVSWSEGELTGRPVELPPPPSPPPGAEFIEVTWRDLVVGSRFPCTVLARRSVFEADDCGEFDEGYGRLGCEDRDMWIRIAARHRIAMLPERLVTLHRHSDNMSNRPETQLAGIGRLREKTKSSEMWKREGLLFRSAIKALDHYTASLLFGDNGRLGLSFKHALLSLVGHPLPLPPRLCERPPMFRFKRIFVAGRRLIGRAKSRSK